jgi:hypothetical protein
MNNPIFRKALLLFFCILPSAFLLKAQAPQGIPYQAIARNASGVAIANTAVKVRFSIRDSIATGAIKYQETHNPTTSALGLFSVNVGMGTVVNGTFSGINWGKNAKFLQVELNTTGGTTYTDLGTTQMMSVPYALYAGASQNIPQSSDLGDMLFWNGSGWTKLPIGQNEQTLRVCDGLPTWGPCYPKSVIPQVFNIMPTSVLLYGEITTNGGSPVTEKGFVWDTVPTVSINSISKAIVTDTGSKIYFPVSNLIPSKVYYVKVFAKNSAGYGLSSVFQFMTLSKPTNLQVGSSYAGGIVAVLYSGGNGVDYHGIIATPTSYGGDWNSAMNNSKNLVLNGYEDWYLPSQIEFFRMCQNKNIVGGFVPNQNWCREDYGSIGSVVEVNGCLYSASDIGSWQTKATGLPFRPVRAF